MTNEWFWSMISVVVLRPLRQAACWVTYLVAGAVLSNVAFDIEASLVFGLTEKRR